MKAIRELPGPGGSLGECGVCGQSFALECILGEPVQVMGHPDLQQDFPVHDKCKRLLIQAQKSQDWSSLPDGPLRRVIKETNDI